MQSKAHFILIEHFISSETQAHFQAHGSFTLTRITGFSAFLVERVTAVLCSKPLMDH